MTRKYKEIPGVEWTGETGDFIRVDEKRCTGCANCLRVCLGDCYEILEKKARIKNLDACMECGACWYACPEDAIDFSWPPGGTGFRTEWG
jgi:NAD-dependent dihydropyrimidine dehydrogenase PreA subunit